MNWLIGVLGGFALLALWAMTTLVAYEIGIQPDLCWWIFFIGGSLTWLAWNIYWVEIRK